MIDQTLIVPAHLRDQCANLCWALAGDPGQGMFERGLHNPQPYVAPPEDPEDDWTPPAKPDPSHYMSTGLIAPEFSDALPLTSTDEEGNLTTRPADYAALIAMADAAGVTITQPEFEAMLSQCDISDQPWRVAVARLGLSVNPVYEDVT